MKQIGAAIAALVMVTLLTGTAGAALQRTVNGPESVSPGSSYSFYVSGFAAGERIYPTVQPAACARTSERCEQDPCPGCAATIIGRAGTAVVRFRWPRHSVYAAANMSVKSRAWKRGSRALIRIDLASKAVAPGCRRMRSLTANPRAGSIVCAATLTEVR